MSKTTSVINKMTLNKWGFLEQNTFQNLYNVVVNVLYLREILRSPLSMPILEPLCILFIYNEVDYQKKLRNWEWNLAQFL